MNTFKALLMICATLSASCSGQYATQSATQGWAGQQPAASPAVASYANLGGLKGSQISYASSSMNMPAAGTGAGSTCAPAAATQQICTCITVNAGQQTADNTGSNQATAPVATPISAPSYAVPAASSSSGSQQNYASQSAPAQSGGDHRGPVMAAYPAAGASAQTNGGY